MQLLVQGHVHSHTPQFVQALSNPLYIQHLASQKYFEDEDFVRYLDYLQYFKEPKYIKFLQ